MKRLFFTAGIAAMLLMAFQCEDLLESSYPIYIDNESELVISSYLAMDGKGGVAYPDTTLSFDKNQIGYTTKPGNRAHRSLPLHTIENWISSLPGDTLSIFIFSEEALDNYDWSEIQSDYRILQRYDLSVEDIKKLSNENDIPIITYPPTEAMKDMKMYPAYQ